jgi:steroid delta-isomerase-like uncharacterized protein
MDLSTALPPERLAARLATVHEHVRAENAHDLDAIMSTFGDSADYDDGPWSEHHAGHDAVRSYYAELMRSVPDLKIDVQRENVSQDAVILEVVIRGTHAGPWRGLPGTGRPIAVPLCAIYAFDDRDRLASESIYYDRATVLRQLGVFHEPQTLIGQLTTALTHPATLARAVVRRLRSNR